MIEHYVVLDTNIVLLDHSNLISIGKKATIVLPETVLAEIDSFKTNMGELGFQARAFSRMLSNASSSEIASNHRCTWEERLVQGVKVHLVSMKEYPKIDSNSGSIYKDIKTIHVAQYYTNNYNNINKEKVTFMTNDLNCGFYARAKGVVTREYKAVQQVNFNFTKRLILKPEIFATLQDTEILKLDSKYAPENYNYIFINKDSQQEQGAIIFKNRIQVIDKEEEKSLRKQAVSPIGFEQLLLSKAILTKEIDVVVCEAKAGTGKTLVSISNAMKLLSGNNQYRSIIYVRASIDDVDKAEEVGFLSGNAEKFEVYFNPLMDSLDRIVRNTSKSTKQGKELDEEIEQKVNKMIKKYNINCLTGLGMRGRTFDNAIIIIDEVQGQSKASLQKMLTRVGRGCKVVIIGSQKQIDNPYVTKYNNGLSVLLDEATKGQKAVCIYATQLNKVVRSKFSEWSEDVFTKAANN